MSYTIPIRSRSAAPAIMLATGALLCAHAVAQYPTGRPAGGQRMNVPAQRPQMAPQMRAPQMQRVQPQAPAQSQIQQRPLLQAPQSLPQVGPRQSVPNNTQITPRSGAQVNNAVNLSHGAHLGEWIQQHSSLNPQQQQRALHNEPGFNQLPQPMQQRMEDRLARLNSMPEQQRNRVIQGGETFERLTPDQRGNVRSAMGQLGALPTDRRQMVARSFRELRNLPPAERNQLLNSPQYRQQFSDEERGTLGNLLAVSPLLPPSR